MSKVVFLSYLSYSIYIPKKISNKHSFVMAKALDKLQNVVGIFKGQDLCQVCKTSMYSSFVSLSSVNNKLIHTVCNAECAQCGLNIDDSGDDFVSVYRIAYHTNCIQKDTELILYVIEHTLNPDQQRQILLELKEIISTKANTIPALIGDTINTDDWPTVYEQICYATTCFKCFQNDRETCEFHPKKLVSYEGAQYTGLLIGYPLFNPSLAVVRWISEDDGTTFSVVPKSYVLN